MASTPKTLKRDDEIVFAKGTNFTPLMVQYRAAFGIFASEGFTDSTRNGEDPVEVMIAVVALLALIWKYLPFLRHWKNSAGHLDTFHGSWRFAVTVLEVAELLESVLLFLAMRLITDLAETSVGSSYSSTIATARSLVLFVVVSSMVQARKRVPNALFASPTEVGDALASFHRNPRQFTTPLKAWFPFF